VSAPATRIRRTATPAGHQPPATDGTAQTDPTPIDTWHTGNRPTWSPPAPSRCSAFPA